MRKQDLVDDELQNAFKHYLPSQAVDVIRSPHLLSSLKYLDPDKYEKCLLRFHRIYGRKNIDPYGASFPRYFFLAKDKSFLDAYLFATYIPLIGLKTFVEAELKQMTLVTGDLQVHYLLTPQGPYPIIDPWSLYANRRNSNSFKKQTLGDHLIFELINQVGYETLEKYLPTIELFFSWGNIQSHYLRQLGRSLGLYELIVGTKTHKHIPPNKFCLETHKPLVKEGLFADPGWYMQYIEKKTLFKRLVDFRSGNVINIEGYTASLLSRIVDFIQQCEEQPKRSKTKAGYTPPIHDKLKKALANMKNFRILVRKKIVSFEDVFIDKNIVYGCPVFKARQFLNFLKTTEEFSCVKYTEKTLIFQSYNISKLLVEAYRSYIQG